jgi:hypothetical protein
MNLAQRHTGRPRKRDNLLTEGGGDGDFFPSIIYSILSGITGVCCPHSLAVSTANQGNGKTGGGGDGVFFLYKLFNTLWV